MPAGRAAGLEDLGRAAGWFPVVGLLLGGVLAGAVLVADALAPPAVGSVLVVALWALLTGGLHLDGLADTLDGLGGGWTREEALRLMREGGIGAYGAAGLVLVLALKLAALTSLPEPQVWRAAVVAPVLGRMAPLLLARLCPPARDDGAGRAFALTVGTPGLVAGCAVAVVATLVLAGTWGVLLVALAVVGAAVAAVYLQARLGGLTGDCLGAMVELTEAATLAGISGLAASELL